MGMAGWGPVVAFKLWALAIAEQRAKDPFRYPYGYPFFGVQYTAYLAHRTH
jgi:hypothetical protein